MTVLLKAERSNMVQVCQNARKVSQLPADCFRQAATRNYFWFQL